MRRTAAFVATLTVLALHGGTAPPPSAAAQGRVVVLLSQEATPYRQAVRGLEEQLAKSGLSAQIDTRVVGDATEATSAAPSVVVAVGAAALERAMGVGGGAPVVACMVLDADAIRKAQNATGVHLEFPVDTELAWLKKILPEARHVGVLYHSDENDRRVERARRVAAELGLTIHARRVESPAEIPTALEAIGKTADVLWGLADPVVLNPDTAKQILLFSLRNRVPFAGLSLAWAKAGALYALDRDYQDVGRQCGEAVTRILRGEAPSAVAVAAPRRVVFAVNRRAADQMKIAIAASVLREAAEVVQ